MHAPDILLDTVKTEWIDGTLWLVKNKYMFILRALESLSVGAYFGQL